MPQYVVCSSVCQSTCLSICDIQLPWSHRLEYYENCTIFCCLLSYLLCVSVLSVLLLTYLLTCLRVLGLLRSAVRTWQHLGLSHVSSLCVLVVRVLLSVSGDRWGVEADWRRKVRTHGLRSLDSGSSFRQFSLHGTRGKCLEVSISYRSPDLSSYFYLHCLKKGTPTLVNRCRRTLRGEGLQLAGA